MCQRRQRCGRVHLTTSPLDWYAARAAGVAAYVLLTVVVCLGMTMAGRKSLRRWPRFALEDVHRFGGLLVGSFVVIHVATIAIDSYLPFSLTALVVPFTASYRTLFTALGVVAAELLLALAVTNRYRDTASVHVLAAGALPQPRGLERCDRRTDSAAAPTGARRGC